MHKLKIVKGKIFLDKKRITGVKNYELLITEKDRPTLLIEIALDPELLIGQTRDIEEEKTMKEFNVDDVIEKMEGMTSSEWEKIKAAVDMQFSQLYKLQSFDECDVRSTRIRTIPFRTGLSGKDISEVLEPKNGRITTKLNPTTTEKESALNA